MIFPYCAYGSNEYCLNDYCAVFVTIGYDFLSASFYYSILVLCLYVLIKLYINAFHAIIILLVEQ